jgi:hypothetical protein
MPTFDVLSGTWYHITAPDLETAEKAYDAYWDVDEQLPEGCKVEEGEVDSHWIPVDLDGPDLTLQEFQDIVDEPAPPTGFEPRENAW